MLIMLIFAAANAGINTAGLYSTKIPESQQTISEAQAVDFSNSMSKVSTNPWTSLEMLGTSLRFIVELAISILTIAPMLMNLGFPVWLALIFSAPTTLVLVWGVYEIATGHVSLPQD